MLSHSVANIVTGLTDPVRCCPAPQINAITAAAEAACLILSVDETVRNPKSEGAEQGMAAGMGGRGNPMARGRGRGRGRGMRR